MTRIRSNAKVHVSFVPKLIIISGVIWFLRCLKQETDDLCSYIAEEGNNHGLAVGILLAFWLTQTRRWINNAEKKKPFCSSFGDHLNCETNECILHFIH
jgi:hypothetical protein